MANFCVKLDWIIGYSNIWLNILFTVSVRVFLEEHRICNGGLSKVVCPPQCEWI